MSEDCVGIACNNTCPKASSTSSASSSRKSTIAGSDITAPVEQINNISLKRKCIAFLPLLFSQNSEQPISANSLGIVTVKELLELNKTMTSRGFDRSVRQTIPSTRRKVRTSPRSSSVSSDMRASSRLETQDLIEAEREYQRQEELEKSASDLAMEAMEYKFLSRRKRLMARKLAQKTKDVFDERQQTRTDNNGNVVNVSRSGTESVAPDLSLSITTKMDFCDPEVLLEKPEARRELTADESITTKHDREMKKYDESESNDNKRSRFTASLIRTHTSDSDQEPEEDSGYEAKSCLTDTTQMDPSRAVSRGSFSSSLRPLSSEFEESAWGSQELLESDSSSRKKSTKSRSSDDLELEHEMFQDAEECLESLIKYGDFEAGGIETPAEYEVIDLPPTRIDVKDKLDKNDKNNYTKDLSTPLSSKTRKPRIEGRRSTSDPVRDRMSSQTLHIPSVVRRGSTAMPYHFAMPSSTLVGYMKPTVASLRARYEREDIDGNNILQTSARERFKIADEDNYRAKKAEEELKSKKLDEERNKRYEEWLKKLDEVNIIPQSAKDRVKKLENEIYRIKKQDDSESNIARAYRRRVLDEDNELVFPISRKTQTKPDLSYQVKMISRSSQRDDISTNDVSVNTEIDFRLMSALLDKLLIAKTSVGVQTDWKNAVVETRDVGISTDRVLRERYSPLPSLRSISSQTEVSTIRLKDKSVATDPEITGHRRNRSLRDSLSTRLSSGVQTDQKWISRRDVSCEANFSSESEESVVSAYPKGFDPKTGQLLDEKLLSNYYRINDQNSKYGVRSRENNLHKLSKTPEPIIEEYGSSTSSESYSEGDYNCDVRENVREVYREKYAEYQSTKPIPKTYYMRREEKRVHLDLNDRKRNRDRNFLETDLEQFEREPIRPEIRAKFAEKTRSEPRHEFSFKTPQTSQTATKPLPVLKTRETQTTDILTVEPQTEDKTPVKFMSKDMKTESKIIVEVTKAHKKERSEVTSLTKLNEDGKMSRTTRVTTSKHIPVEPNRNQIMKLPETKMQSISAPQRPLSPIRKAQSEINVTPVSDVSTRPASAVDLSMQSQSVPKMSSTISLDSSAKSPVSSLKSPSPTFTRYSDEISVPRVGRVSIQDPMHLVLIAPPESFDTKEQTLMNGETLLMPINKSKWRETSSSTICNEMSTDAFKDEEGNVQKPKSISMTTETLIENKGSESQIHTRSRTARKYAPEMEEKSITTESSFTGPEGINKNSYPYIESASQPISPPQSSASPLVTLVDTPDIPDLISPEPEPEPDILRLSKRKRTKDNEITSLAQDVHSSRYRPDEVECNKLVDTSTGRRAAIVEPVQQLKSAFASDDKRVTQTSTSPATEIITRIIRTSEPNESNTSRKSKTVLEQEFQSGDNSVDGGGCKISSSVTFENPNTLNRGVVIKELNEDGTSKDGSMDNLDQKSGEVLTQTNFQRFKSPRRASNGCEETSWKYSMECNCINGSNTTVRTTVDYKKITYPLTSYETSL